MSVRSYCGPPNPCINILGSLRDTTVDGGLYVYETNNNNVIKGQRSSFFGNLLGSVTLRRNSYYSTFLHDPITDRSMQISKLLNENEKKAVLKYVGKESSLMATGVCELLEEFNGSWKTAKKGILCLIMEKSTKTYSISLLEPSTTNVCWLQSISRSFQTTKDHDHLVTFEIASEKADESRIYGLNFYDADEAQYFHSSVTDQYNSYFARRQPTREAPARPVVASEHILSPSVTQSAITADPDVLLLPEKKEKKPGFLRKFLKPKKGKKNKKEKSTQKLTTNDISPPTDFEHLCGAHFTSEEKEAVEILQKNIQFDQNNPDQRNLIRRLATEFHQDIRASMREKPSQSFQRGTGIEGARSSIMLPKTTKGNTLREIKRSSANKKNESIIEEKEPNSSNEEEKNDAESTPYDPIHPNWEKDEPSVIPTFSPPLPSHSSNHTSSHTQRYSTTNNNDYTINNFNNQSVPVKPPSVRPNAPSRTASRLVRQNTPPHPDVIGDRDPSRPRLPDSNEPIPTRLSYHFTRRVSTSPPSTPPPPLMSPQRPPPPTTQAAISRPSAPPLPSVITKKTVPPVAPPVAAPLASPVAAPVVAPPVVPTAPPLPMNTPPASAIIPKAPPPPVSAVIPKAPPPPPLTKSSEPPNNRLSFPSPSISPGPPVSPDRRSFLDEIQNVDRSKLLRSTTSASPEKQSIEVDGGIMSSIQRMMNSIRPQLEDSDSDSDDSTSTDSDWSE